MAMKIDKDIWERVMELATLLVDAGRPDQYWELYNQLLAYCEEQRSVGRDHPFLWETLADFTTDDRAAIPIYLQALELAGGDEAKPYRVSVRFALAERHRSLGLETEARAYAIAADDEARSIDDLELRRQISQFLLAAG